MLSPTSSELSNLESLWVRSHFVGHGTDYAGLTRVRVKGTNGGASFAYAIWAPPYGIIDLSATVRGHLPVDVQFGATGPGLVDREVLGSLEAAS
jgi:hypothetical protein